MTKSLRLGLAGLGTVGTGVLDALQKHGRALSLRTGRPVELVAITARNADKPRGAHDLSRLQWVNDAVRLAAMPDIDVFIELIGGEGDPARSAVETALKSGKHVVTANKALLAHHGAALARLADEKSVGLYFEAAVAGGIPIVKAMRESLAGNGVKRVTGILNGTCNYILTKMTSEGRDFAEVLQEAQKLGYAEADPSFDVGGHDTAHRLAILTSLAFGTEPSLESVYIEGIENITREDIRNAHDLGYKIKLLGVAVQTEDGIEQRVHPTLVKKGSPMAEVDGVFNAVAVNADFTGDLMLEGRGAGAHPTAASVLSDIGDIAQGNRLPAFGIPAAQLKPYRRAALKAHEGGYYVALELFDRPGSVAGIANRLAEQKISIESIVQRAPQSEQATAPFILITHDTLESSMRKALENIEADGHVAKTPRMIRIERI
jgi:homoserine dehydrogenase